MSNAPPKTGISPLIFRARIRYHDLGVSPYIERVYRRSSMHSAQWNLPRFIAGLVLLLPTLLSGEGKGESDHGHDHH